MSEQEEIIKRMGETLRSLHIDKYDPDKDEFYWQNFALECERVRASRLGLAKQFDAAVSEGKLRDIQHQISILTLIEEHKTDKRMSFIMGVTVGAVLAFLLPVWLR